MIHHQVAELDKSTKPSWLPAYTCTQIVQALWPQKLLIHHFIVTN